MRFLPLPWWRTGDVCFGTSSHGGSSERESYLAAAPQAPALGVLKGRGVSLLPGVGFYDQNKEQQQCVDSSRKVFKERGDGSRHTGRKG